ncbi:helix-turn-helix domain-containing protein [Facklamia sp. DSM 111018]|uniref:Helix-turn-helix domain-containing protein n=1 Tax=Facklamia lactis TaxID=2749967 RepID=A0ABS0LSI9_9LACT|nr:PucR family transcriptional regulator [Facklamia lactis]MBG9981177.1 helix-turn-helix domain-containing protein [Facklamia lactis]MBG9986979.1 helix-turn-helix domain-containing protein [Facklamia lactis]
MLDDIQKIFPNSQLNPKLPLDLEQYFMLPYHTDRLYIPYSELDPKTVALLNLLSQNIQVQDPNKQRSFNPVLLPFSSMVSDKPVRFLYLQVDKLSNAFDSQLWQETLIASFPSLEKMQIFGTQHYVGSIAENKWESEQFEFLKGLLITLDDDFDIITKSILGLPVHAPLKISSHLASEFQLFYNQITSIKSQHLTLISTLLLHQISHRIVRRSEILDALQQQLLIEPENKQMIIQLFHNGGNLSQSAKDLFIHRNTLTYRIQKLFQVSGLDLHTMPDLTLAYLLVN